MAGNDAYSLYLETLQNTGQKKKHLIVEDNTVFFVFVVVLTVVLLWLFL
jgi:hypothetical protein